MNIAPIDLVVLVGYFSAMLLIGWASGRRNLSTDSYFLGGRSFSGFVLGMSLIGTIISSVTFIAGPADSFKTAWLRIVTNLSVPFAALFVAFTFVPFFRRHQISSAYAYINHRFSSALSLYAAGIFLVTQLVRVSMVGYLLALLLQSLISLPFLVCLIITGGVTALYTVHGGFSAVVWTDVIQTVILIAGAVVATWVIIDAVPGGLSALIEQAVAARKFSFWDLNPATGQLEPTSWSFSLTEKTVTMLFVAGLIGFLSANLDQTNIQRWASARSTKDARKAVLVLALGAVPIWVVFKFLGTALWVFFEHYPSDVSTAILAGQRKAEEIVPYFITVHLKPGLSGLVIAGALAAAMSTLSASINSSSMVWVRDFCPRFSGTAQEDAKDLRMAKFTAWTISLVMILGAWLIHWVEAKTLNDLLLMLSPIIGGTVPGIFLLGLFTRSVHARGIWVGLTASWLVIGYVLLSHWQIVPSAYALRIDLYYVGIVGNTLTILVALIACRFLSRQARDTPCPYPPLWSLK